MHWAEPDITAAAAAMRSLHSDVKHYHKLSIQVRGIVNNEFSPLKRGSVMLDRLCLIYQCLCKVKHTNFANIACNVESIPNSCARDRDLTVSYCYESVLGTLKNRINL